MQFVREVEEQAVKTIAERLEACLRKDRRVLWLTSGGSNTRLEVAIMRLLQTRCADKLGGLAVMPMDERYGSPGHADSNTEQLREAGFEPRGASWIDILARDLPFDQTVAFYTDVAAAAFANAAEVIGQFGIGPDGHIAGILPESPATAPGSATIIGYEWDDYTRLTLSADMLKRVTVAYAPCYGENKAQALERLRRNNEPFDRLPAKLLYEMAEVYVYNDRLGSEDS